MRNRLLSIAVCAMVSICSSAAAVAIYHHWFAVRIVAADTAGFMRQARADYLNRKITPKQLEQRIEQAMGLIRQQPANSIVLTSDVVLSGNVTIIAP